MARPATTPWRHLETFWLKPIATARFGVVRTMLGVTVLLWSLSFAPDLFEIYGRDGFTGGLRFSRAQFLVIFKYGNSNVVIVAAYACLVLASVALIAGRFTRVALPITAALLITFHTAASTFTFGTENVMRVLAIQLALFAALTPSWYLDRSIFRSHPSSGERVLPAWGVRLVQCQITVIYVTAAISKWQGEAWREGVAAFHALAPVHTLRFSLRSIFF